MQLSPHNRGRSICWRCDPRAWSRQCARTARAAENCMASTRHARDRSTRAARKAPRKPKFVSKTDEPPALSRRQTPCNIKDLQTRKDDVFPSKYLKHTDLQGKPTTAAIERAVLEMLKSPEGKTQDKIVLYFAGAKKSLPLNVTNFDAVADRGGDTDDWSGCQIELYPSKTQMAGKTVDCIRVRAPTKPIKRQRPSQAAAASITKSRTELNVPAPPECSEAFNPEIEL